MTRWLRAAKSAIDAGTKPTELTEPRPEPVLSVASVLSEAERAVSERCAPNVAIPDLNVRGKTFPHGVCEFSDRPRTWTDKVVALDEWRQLSEWEREGPAGRLWCGLCRAWVARGGGCEAQGCWSRDDAG